MDIMSKKLYSVIKENQEAFRCIHNLKLGPHFNYYGECVITRGIGM